MSVQVRFRGVSLFRQFSDRVEVLIPTTRPNGSHGLPEHYPRLVVWNSTASPATIRGPDPEWHRRLTGGVVVSLSASPWAGRPDFSKTPRLNDVHGLRLRPDSDLAHPVIAARIILNGGMIAPTNWNVAGRPRDWKFPDPASNHEHLAYELTWTADADEIGVSFSDGQPASAMLHDGETIMIGNRPDYDLDYWHPVHDHRHGHCMPNAPVADKDFAWIYDLLQNVPHRPPVPEAICPGTLAGHHGPAPRGAGSPTCFMAWWE